MTNWKYIITPLILVTYLMLSLKSLTNSNSWWKFSTKGEVYSSPRIFNNKIYFGNNEGYLYAVDMRRGKEIWKYKTGYEIFSPPFFYKNKVFFTSANTLYALEAKNGKESWRFSSDSLSRFVTDVKFHKGQLFLGDAAGTLYSLDTKGNLKWRFHSKKITKLSAVLINTELNWFGKSFELKKGVIYWGSMDGNLYAISTKNGKLKWEFDTQDTISTSVAINRGKVYLGTKDGRIVVLQQGNGKLIHSWKDSKNTVKCVIMVDKIFPWQEKDLLISYSDGSIFKKTLNGKSVWDYKKNSRYLLCPVEEYSTVFITDKKGSLTALDSKTGKKKWGFQTKNKITITPLVTRVRFSPKVYLFESNGTLTAIKVSSGKKIWSFRTYAGVYTDPALTNNYFFLTSSDGGLYRINKFTGKAAFPIFSKNRLQFSEETIKIGDNKIIELTVKYDDSILTNPWKDTSVKSIFTHEKGRVIEVNGFYFDKNTWKVRFNPPLKKQWHWRLIFELAGHSWEKSGSFSSDTDTNKTFLKVSHKNPKRLTLEEKTIFNGLGFQNSIMDYNQNGYPLDDWAIGNSEPLQIIRDSENTTYIPSDKINDLSTYLASYGPKKAGFNLYRYNVDNWSFSLWRPSGIYNEFLLNEGKWADEFLSELKNNGYHIWMTIFGFGVPYSHTLLEIEKKELSAYIDYVVARYGAYVSIWEIANEANLTDPPVDLIAKKIRSVDFESRPISISWEKPLHPNIDIISPHWYETEPLSSSDLSTINKIDKFFYFDKPVIFGEQGNHILNWDKDSAVRMRIRSWTAFFNEGMLIFWNTSDKKQTKPINPDKDIVFSNQYIGEEERRYMKILQDFTNGVDISAARKSLSLTNLSVRGYGLSSNKEEIGYLYHFDNQQEETSASIETYLSKDGLLEWINPTSGKTLLKQNLEMGYNLLISPYFNIDMAFKIKYN